MDRSVVYFIQGPPGTPIKIGITTQDPEDRLRGIQTGSPHRLRILRTEPGGRSRELQLHRRFAAARLEGEWFEPTPALLAYIDHAPAGGPGRAFRSAAGQLAAAPAGAWRIVAAVLLVIIHPPARRRARYRRPAAIAALAATAATAAYLYLPDPAHWWAIGAITAAACLTAGTRKNRR